MLFDQIRHAIATAPRSKLSEVGETLWRALGAGTVSEAEATEGQGLLELRMASGAQPGARRKAVGSSPRTDTSMERRRRWAASGRLPPAIAAAFTLAEQAVLSLIAAEFTRRGDCRMAIDHMAAIIGCSRSTVKNALREAKQLRLLTVEERKVTGFRNDTNIVRIVSVEWQSWLKMTRKTYEEGRGVKSVTSTPTKGSNSSLLELRNPKRGLPSGRDRPSPIRSDWNRGVG